jgi:hypothetical protein
MKKTRVKKNHHHGQYNGTSYAPRPCAKKRRQVRNSEKE